VKEENEVVAAYDEACKDYFFTRTSGNGMAGFHNREVERPIMFRLLPPSLAGSRLLDVGCGPGIHLEEYCRRGAEGCGMDASPNMIDLARQKCPSASFTVADIYKIPTAEEIFDFITASFLLDHVRDLDRAAAEIHRVLKPGGQFFVSLPHPISYMFRSKKGFVPSNSYFDREPFSLKISSSTSKRFIEYPRTMEGMIKPFLSKGFSLIRFVENSPDDRWPEKYRDLGAELLRIPCLSFFVWERR
jgi:ubiquinone/menaquinone biosynthesis C-methylase UbiE